jgi:hypothetical protein
LPLSCVVNASRSCVSPVLLIAATPAAFSVPVDHARFAGGLLSVPTAAAVAAAWKSLTCSAALPPNAPVCASTCS